MRVPPQRLVPRIGLDLTLLKRSNWPSNVIQLALSLMSNERAIPLVGNVAQQFLHLYLISDTLEFDLILTNDVSFEKNLYVRKEWEKHRMRRHIWNKTIYLEEGHFEVRNGL